MNLEIMPIEKLISDVDSIEYRDKQCCYVKCTNTAILSHTIAKNCLYKLNDDLREVLTFQRRLNPINSKVNPRITINVKVDDFSTFTGFCAIHDNELFRLIDCYDGLLTKEKAVLMHYRNICYGIHHIKTQQAKLRHVAKQNYTQNFLSLKEHETVLKLLRNGSLHRRLEYCLKEHTIRKEQLERMIQLKQFEEIHCFVKGGDLDNPIFCGRSTALMHKNQKIFSYPGYGCMPWVTYMTLRTDTSNDLVFCWLKGDKKYAKYLIRLVEKPEFKSTLSALAYACSDSFAVEKSYYNKHSTAIERLIEKYRSY